LRSLTPIIESDDETPLNPEIPPLPLRGIIQKIERFIVNVGHEYHTARKAVT
jgi:hypothetical protein